MKRSLRKKKIFIISYNKKIKKIKLILIISSTNNNNNNNNNNKNYKKRMRIVIKKRWIVFKVFQTHWIIKKKVKKMIKIQFNKQMITNKNFR